MKPYQLVWFRPADWYGGGYVGEAMSFPFPSPSGEEHIMLRRVPGHPGTLVEVPTRSVSYRDNRSFGSYRWVAYARVSGTNSFPVDMLRYDQAAPVNFTISDDEFYRAIPNEGETELLIARAVRFKRSPWTTARWASFGWTCEHLRTIPLEETQ